MASKKKKKPVGITIAENRRARHDFQLEDTFEAGLVLQGWEVKALRAGLGQITDTYVHVRDGEAWLINAHFTPLASASTHVIPDPIRQRKLLLHAREISRIFNAITAKGYTCVATRLYWKENKVKLELALAKGKQAHDKRKSVAERDWARQKERLMKHAG
ncbi:MAG: SsrA-binding protein SmpB [Pseudomonadota bacterium]